MKLHVSLNVERLVIHHAAHRVIIRAIRVPHQMLIFLSIFKDDRGEYKCQLLNVLMLPVLVRQMLLAETAPVNALGNVPYHVLRIVPEIAPLWMRHQSDAMASVQIHVSDVLMNAHLIV